MAIGKYIREIGRGKDGARALAREQAEDLMGQILDGLVTDLEIGAFCLAMRIKGETPQEMVGFLDAIHARMARLPASDGPLIVIPSYNGARRLPVLTPLLAMLLAREGMPVLMHGTATEASRISTEQVLAALDIRAQSVIEKVAAGTVQFVPTALLCRGLQNLLDVRRVVNLRNPAHALVKLMNPCAGPALLVTSYTHPEYAVSMAATLQLAQANALLLRGTEGEAVADARRTPRMQAFLRGLAHEPYEPDTVPLSNLPKLPMAIDANATAAYIRAALAGDMAVPEPIARQVRIVCQLVQSMRLPGAL